MTPLLEVAKFKTSVFSQLRSRKIKIGLELKKIGECIAVNFMVTRTSNRLRNRGLKICFCSLVAEVYDWLVLEFFEPSFSSRCVVVL